VDASELEFVFPQPAGGGAASPVSNADTFLPAQSKKINGGLESRRLYNAIAERREVTAGRLVWDGTGSLAV